MLEWIMVCQPWMVMALYRCCHWDIYVQRCLEGISRDEPRLGTAMRVDGFLFTYIYPLNNWTCAVKKNKCLPSLQISNST